MYKIKKYIVLVVSTSTLILTACGDESVHTLRISTTTSVQNSGLLDYLIEEFESYNFTSANDEEYKIEIDYIANGSGAAIELGKSGDVDLLIVHSEEAELAFMEDGHGVSREQFMYNFFYITGPDTIVDERELCNNLFYSRGDNSGTHVAEKNMWLDLGCKPTGENYKETGKGMLDTLVIANEQNGYTLTDNATWLKNSSSLQYLQKVANGPENRYSVITVNPEKNSKINEVDAILFYNWLISDETGDFIEAYKINGESLFYKL